MGLFFRRTTRVARRANLTLTSRGISLSTGVKGARISSRGLLTLARGSVRFRKKLF
jgi:Protein of unknown function (DUF4236)